MKQEFCDALERMLTSEQIRYEEPMSKHTTFRVGGNAEVLVTPSVEQVDAVIRLAKEHGIGITVIGNGSNLLVSDKGISGMVVAFGKNAEYVVSTGLRICVGAGTMLSKVAAEAARNGQKGLEFAAGIPGTVGGAVVMNAGAYGGEMKDVLESVKVLTPEGAVITLYNKDLELSYRHSCILEKGYIVLEATFLLEEGDISEIRALMEDFKSRRVEKQPLEYPSAGSTFKRPEGYFAGKLIEDAGLKGFTLGGAQVSRKHCGFVINTGNACAQDIYNLIQEVTRQVKEQFQVTLEPEVKLMGEFE